MTYRPQTFRYQLPRPDGTPSGVEIELMMDREGDVAGRLNIDDYLWRNDPEDLAKIKALDFDLTPIEPEVVDMGLAGRGGAEMTNEERIELLRQVAECAPKEWKAFINDLPCALWTINPSPWNGAVILTLTDDLTDARAIIAMLDAMEKAGYVPRVQLANEASYRCDWKHRDEPISALMRTVKGATRSKAVARAFVQVFGVKP